jgi:hypothetical protein
MCLKGTRPPQIKEAGIVIKRSFTLKVAFLAFNAIILAFIATSLLLIPRHFSTKSATSTFKATSLTLA